MLRPRDRARLRTSIGLLAGAIAIALASGALAAAPVADSSVHAQHAMVVSESQPASLAGIEILNKGGNAIDAACATALATGVTNASSCGIGGGGFMLIYLASTGKIYALDYRECAPLKATENMYVRDGKPDEMLARSGPLAVAVPGEIAGIDAALKRFGTMKFHEVAAPAIKLARDGFALEPPVSRELPLMASELKKDPGLAAIFFRPDGTPAKTGESIHEKELAATLEALGDDPAHKFYNGQVATDLAAFVQEHGGILSADDLAKYQPIWREPLHRAFQGYEIYVMPPPSSGGVLLEMLGMLEPGHLGGLGVDSPPYLARLIEIMRQGFIDRDQYGDPDFVHVPIDTLLSAEHINEARERALHHSAAQPAQPHDHGTANLLVVDKDGNVAALTTTINTPFGARMMVPKLGIILNDEMDDFAVAPGVANAFHLAGAQPNAIAPGKRPLSSMSPMIAIRKGKPMMTAGGSGGPAILSGVLQVTLNILVSHLGPAEAIETPRVHEQASPDVVAVEEAMPAKTRAALDKMGYQIRPVRGLGAVGAITIAPGNLRADFDHRKSGAAIGN
ncbi:MAG TPA: gamma-glutamyltransferase [Candidatus Binataceae bacterium]|nr:gamma-glutamyltransferase [Candidatus Binataceae bacterium]